MRTTFLVLAGFAPLAACSEAFVMAPLPAPAVVSVLGAVPTQGHPGLAGPRLRIRGGGPTLPTLFVFDGVVVSSSQVNSLDIEDIEHIEVIKGPAAAALYGKGSICPAIVIRTKRLRSTPSPAR